MIEGVQLKGIQIDNAGLNITPPVRTTFEYSISHYFTFV